MWCELSFPDLNNFISFYSQPCADQTSDQSTDACARLAHIQTSLHWSSGISRVLTGEKRGGRKGRLVARQGIQTPASILIKQICHKSFYKCPVGGYRGWWKHPIHAVSSPAGLKPRLLARLSVLTASDPLAICRVGCPAPRALCVLTLRRFNTEAGQKKEEGKKILPTRNSCSCALTAHRHKLKWKVTADGKGCVSLFVVHNCRVCLALRPHKQMRLCGQCWHGRCTCLALSCAFGCFFAPPPPLTAPLCEWKWVETVT